jgi:hypothetical protein
VDMSVVMRHPFAGAGRIQVMTSQSTKVLTDARTSLSQLNPGADVVAVGRIGRVGWLPGIWRRWPAWLAR